MTQAIDQQEQDQISIIWHIDDVLSLRPDLTRAEARAVLRRVEDSHDAARGICWGDIEDTADELFPAAPRQHED